MPIPLNRGDKDPSSICSTKIHVDLYRFAQPTDDTFLIEYNYSFTNVDITIVSEAIRSTLIHIKSMCPQDMDFQVTQVELKQEEHLIHTSKTHNMRNRVISKLMFSLIYRVSLIRYNSKPFSNTVAYYENYIEDIKFDSVYFVIENIGVIEIIPIPRG